MTLFDPDDPSAAPLFSATAPPTLVPVPPGKGSIESKFRAFHAANPWVYDALVRLARDMKRRGRRRMGIGMLFEVLRWHWWRATVDPSSDFKLNNNYRSRYVRLIMKRESDLAGMFEIRSLKSP